MQIRNATIKDADAIRYLFYDTVTYINSKHYTPRQIEVWRSGYNNIYSWKKKIAEQYFLIAETENKIAGFASLTSEGYLDFMYVNKDLQGKGIAKNLLDALEVKAKELNLKEIITDSSITAKRFFEKKDFRVIQISVKEIGGVNFLNMKMKKILKY